ncbi:MAG TPA: C39 family peptidase [Longilinea sp.]|nr:C39 family peptidase [Longilinea sp.]
MRKTKFNPFLLFLIGIMVVAGVLFGLPSIRDRVVYHFNDWMTQARLFFNPPEEVAFQPNTVATVDLQATLLAGSTLTPTLTAVQETPIPSATPTITSTPLPAQASVSGVTYYSQIGYFNYCAPANLSMAMSYWGWSGSMTAVGSILKPYDRDKNVMPYEMLDYAQTYAELNGVVRVGGNLDVLRRLISAGYPVLVETGVYFRDISGVVSWMGHYQVITAYDDATGILTAQDSYVEANHPEEYDAFMTAWRSFNFTYIVLYPADQESEVMALLGADADETANAQRAYQNASNEIALLSGVDQFFAWYNVGSSLTLLQDYAGAATAYDQAFTLYNTLPEDLTVRPYRILWYQTGPYFAYYYMGRYQDVITLATDNSINLVRDSDPALEESFYWRGLSRAALGDTTGAIEDLQSALLYHPNFPPAVTELQNLGMTP